MNRRELVLAASSLPMIGLRAPPTWAQPVSEVVIGALYPMSGPNAQIGVGASDAFETALDIINNRHAIDIPTAANAGLAGLGNAKVRIVVADHQADPQKGRSEAERLITQDKVCAVIGAYHSSVAATVSATCERFNVPFLVADSTSPGLHRRGLKWLFRTTGHDDLYSKAMFDFLDALRRRGKKIETISLFYEDTLFGVDSSKMQRTLAGERGYKVASDIKYRSNSPSLTAEVQQLKSADADVLMPSSYTTDALLLVKTMSELGYKPRGIVAQAVGFSEKVVYDSFGDKLQGLITRANFALDLGQKRPAVDPVNALFKTRAGRDLNDNTARQLMALIVLADAIDRAKSTDSAKIREALVATDIPGQRTIMPWSRVKFGDDGQNAFADVVLLQYGGDKFMTVYPEDVAVAPATWPMNG